MPQSRQLPVWIAALVLSAVCASPALTQTRDADLDALIDWIGREKSWPDGAREQALDGVENLRRTASGLSDASFFLNVAAVVALADNGHSNVSMNPAYGVWGLLPIRVYAFDDGLYVVRATREHERFLGARLDRVAGHPTSDVLREMGLYHGGTDEFLRAYLSNPLLLTPTLLNAAGLSESAERTEVTLTLADGSSETLELSTWQTDGRHPGTQPWRYLAGDEVPNENGAWVSAAARVDPPWALRDGREIFRYRYLEELGVAHIQLRQNIGREDERIEDFLTSVRDRLKADRPRYVILDNRQNGGGDLTRTAEFARELPTLIPENGRVYSLTANATFSAGIYTAFHPKAADPERTSVVGAHVGDRERFWAEGRGPFNLPGLGIRIGYSVEMHDLVEDCTEEVCHLRKRRKFDVTVASLDPDVRVPSTYADFAAGRDAQVDYVLGVIGGN